jgi:MSHA biogenesis protein MshP
MLVIAIFVITVMIFLAVTLQDVFNKSSQSVAYEVFGARALSAANSGAEVALQKIFNLQGQTPLVFVGAGTSASPATATLTLDSAAFTAAMLSCSVVVEVQKFNVVEATYFYDYIHYRIESTATCSSGGFTTVRTVAVEGRET